MMLYRILCIPLLLLLATPACGTEAKFLARAEIEGAVITLGDIVSFDTETATTRALASQIVDNGPEPGESKLLRADQILRKLNRQLHGLPRDLIWTGPASVSVHRRGVTIDADRISEIIGSYLREHQDEFPDTKVRFIPDTLPLPFTLPSGELSYQVIPSDPSILGSSRFGIIFSVDGRVVKNMSVRGRIEAIARVVTSRTNLKRNTVLRPHHLKMETRDISHLKGYRLSLQEVVGKKITRNLRANRPILGPMLTALPIVHRGDRVKIVVSKGPMLLTATGLAYRDGVRNEMIRVQNLSSRKIIYGRVAAPGIVEVQL